MTFSLAAAAVADTGGLPRGDVARGYGIPVALGTRVTTDRAPRIAACGQPIQSGGGGRVSNRMVNALKLNRSSHCLIALATLPPCWLRGNLWVTGYRLWITVDSVHIGCR